MVTNPAQPGPAADSLGSSPSSPTALPPKTSERLLLEAWPQVVKAGGHEEGGLQRLLCTSAGRAQLARFVAERHPGAAIACVYQDDYLVKLARAEVGNSSPPNLSIVCQADLVAAEHRPETAIDVAALPLSSQGDGELAREQLQQCYGALRLGGRLLAATDNPRDTWLAEQLTTLAGRPKRSETAEGAVYVVERGEGPVRMRNFDCEFAFRDAGRLFQVVSRAGVFSHRRIDPGARRLLDAMEIADGDRVLDIGCGWGPVALAAAARGPQVAVEAFDSNARAVECTRQNAERNGLAAQIVVRLESDGRTDRPGEFDVAIGNPPYYADFRIAELFIYSAARALRPGGRLTMVTKTPERYFETLPRDFTEITAEEVKGYAVVKAERRG